MFWMIARIYIVACTDFKIQFIYECDFIASPQYLYYKNSTA